MYKVCNVVETALRNVHTEVKLLEKYLQEDWCLETQYV